MAEAYFCAVHGLGMTWTVGFARVEQVRGVAIKLRWLGGSWRFRGAVRHDTAQHGATWLRWSWLSRWKCVWRCGHDACQQRGSSGAVPCLS